ncbi:universal stress protein [Dactylosporangium aurantiacum]|uniref:Universal stress protein n=1 Tax=Dactylosporangium aurantiacum TaxID=35754 RepID=A0A9Q9MQS6_9ACTN|nr:universal stress protein [Dactylosporangium aurantiacum]MDG6110121.1 universal stress protein [Dactylosporangium aurantiacum]UWZ57867.1 universal stress protein [Dactylosporangium aurantiacum]
MGRAAIVVGVDGAQTSLDAVRWAAAEAGRHDAPLRVVLAYHWRTPLTAFAPSAALAGAARRVATDVVDGAVREARRAVPGVTVDGTATIGRPAPALLQEAAGAAMLVVGSHAHHAVTGALLGSISQQVAMHACCPVAVVRGRADPGGAVLVGVDGAPTAAHVTRAAFAEARSRGCDLLAVRAVETPMAPCTVGMPPLMYDTAAVRRSLTQEATRLVASVGEDYPDVRWELHGVDGDATEVLVRRTHGAQLAVVGSRGHGGFAGLLLGSVCLHLLHRSQCPVLVARGGAAPEEEG